MKREVDLTVGVTFSTSIYGKIVSTNVVLIWSFMLIECAIMMKVAEDEDSEAEDSVDSDE